MTSLLLINFKPKIKGRMHTVAKEFTSSLPLIIKIALFMIMYSEVDCCLYGLLSGLEIRSLHSSKIMNLEDFLDEEVYGVLIKKTCDRVNIISKRQFY